MYCRKTDRLAVTKLVSKLTRGNLKSPYAVCMLIRIACKMVEDDEEGGISSPYFDFVESCLRHKSEMVGHFSFAKWKNTLYCVCCLFLNFFFFGI